MKVKWTTYPNGYNLTTNRYKFSLVANVSFDENLNRDIRQFQKVYFDMLVSKTIRFHIRSGGQSRSFEITNFTQFLTERAKKEALWKYLFPAQFDENGIQPLGANQAAPLKNVVFSDFHADFFQPGSNQAGFNALNADDDNRPISEMLNLYSLFSTPVEGAAFKALDANAGDISSRMLNTLERLKDTYEKRRQTFDQINYASGDNAFAPMSTDIKFHDALAELAQYPELLRRLGLIIDLELERNLIDGNPAPDHYRITIDTAEAVFPGLSEPEQFPYTVFSNTIILGGKSVPILNSGCVELLVLEEGKYSVLQFEPDEYLSAIMGSANKMRESIEAGDEQNKSPILPGLSKGLMLFLNSRQNENTSTDGTIAGTFNSTIGYRVDVLVNNQNVVVSQNSLNRRQSEFNLKTGPGGFKVIEDEGWITIDAGMKAEETTSTENYKVSNKLFNWDGFSLSCPFPLPALGRQREENRDEGELSPATKYLNGKMEVDKDTVDDSLVPLRFDPIKKYSFRLRSVLPNGYSLSVADANAIQEVITTNVSTTPVQFKRQERLQPPLFILNNALTQYTNKGKQKHPVRFLEGESLHTVVIRNYRDASITSQEAVRHIVPPQGTFQLAEWHGKFDNFYREGRARKVEEFYHVSLAKIPTVLDPGEKPADYFSQEYYRPEIKSFDRIYIPDPACDKFLIRPVGVRQVPRAIASKVSAILSLYMISDADKKKLNFDFSEYPGFKPWKLILKDAQLKMEDALASGRKLYTVSEFNKTITYYLPKGYELDFEIYCETSLSEKIFAASSNILSIFQSFTLVHAVQHPMSVPVIHAFETKRLDPGRKTFMRFEKLITEYDELSTATLELRASWVEYSDNRQPGIVPDEPTVHKRTEYGDILQHYYRVMSYEKPADNVIDNSKAVPVEFVYDAVEKKFRIAPAGDWKNEFQSNTIGLILRKDGKRLLLRSAGDEFETSASMLFVPEKTRAVSVAGWSSDAVELSSEKVLKPFFIEQTDTKFRVKQFQLISVSRFNEYYTNTNSAYASEMRKIEFSKQGPGFPVDIGQRNSLVLNNDRPSAPRIAYIIPLLIWNDKSSGDNIVRTREGNKLRMYFERGDMYDSGGLVQIALKLQATVNPGDTEYSRIGQDIAVERIVDNGNMDSSFFNFTDVQQISNGDSTLNVKLLKPIYSHELDMWYTDITIMNEQYYFPFIQFHVAKYQQYSAQPDQCFSAFVKSDFTQVTPKRHFFASAGDNKVHVGFAVRDNAGKKFPARQENIVHVSFECRKRNSNGNELQWFELEGRPGTNIFANSGTKTIEGVSYFLFEPFTKPDSHEFGDNYRVVIEEFEQHTTLLNRRRVYMDILQVEL